MARHKLYPESVRPGIPKMPRLPPGWRAVPFGELLSPVYRPAELDDEVTYQLVTAKRSRGGIVPREELTGAEIKTKSQFYVQGGDFLISRRQIIHGACGFVPEALSGAVVSGEYDVLAVGPALLPEYLEAFTHTTYFQQSCFQSSVGVDIEKMVFDLDHWFTYPMPLPPLEEQARIAGVLGRIKAALRANERALEQVRRVKKALLSRLLSEGIGHTRFKETEIGRVPEGWGILTVNEVTVGGPSNGRSPPGAQTGVGRPTFSIAAVREGCVNIEANLKYASDDDAALSQFEVRKGDVLVVRGNANLGLVGTAGIVVEEPPPRCIYPDLLMRLRMTPTLDPRFFTLAWNGPAVRAVIEPRAKTTNGTYKVNGADVGAIPVPVPPIAEQRAIIRVLSAADAEVIAITRASVRITSLLDTVRNSTLMKGITTT